MVGAEMDILNGIQNVPFKLGSLITPESSPIDIRLGSGIEVSAP
jgi:hypothetical protein